jgi:hypothetical protein
MCRLAPIHTFRFPAQIRACTVNSCRYSDYVGLLISLWLFLFAAQQKQFFLDGLKKLEQRSRKCVELRGEYVE